MKMTARKSGGNSTTEAGVNKSLPVLFKTDSFRIFTSDGQFQTVLLVINSFGSYGMPQIDSFKIFWLSTPDSLRIPQIGRMAVFFSQQPDVEKRKIKLPRG